MRIILAIPFAILYLCALAIALPCGHVLCLLCPDPDPDDPV